MAIMAVVRCQPFRYCHTPAPVRYGAGSAG
jgi:hypothetical protein